MPNTSVQLPAIDQNICNKWTEQDIDYYNKLPYYFYKATSQFRKYWSTWSKILDKVPWTPNMGEMMKQVGVEPTPVQRQMAFPKLLREVPQVDIVQVKERTTEARLRWKQFVTPHFNFLPSFQDFLRGNIAPHRQNLDRQVSIYEEQYYRTHIFHWSPYVWLAGYGLVDAPSAEGSPDGSTGKSNDWLEANLPKVKEVLSFKELFKALNAFEDEVGATPFEGDGQPNGDSAPLNERFVLIGASTIWNQFLDDPWLKENRPINMNIVTDAFKGDIFGKIRYRHEKYGIRIKVTQSGNNASIEFPAPETVEVNPSAAEYYRTKPNPAYAREAQYFVSFLVGGPSYQIINVGPVPPPFEESDVNGIIGMDWNGKIQMTRNFLVPCVDANGNIVMDTNSWGHYIRLQSEVALGIVGFNKFNVLPIIHFGRSGITTVF